MSGDIMVGSFAAVMVGANDLASPTKNAPDSRAGHVMLDAKNPEQVQVLTVEKAGKTETRTAREAQLAGLYDEYYDRLARYAFAHIGHRADAEDIAGEVFLKALAALGRYQDRGVPMHAWLFTIARNLITDYQRNSRKRDHLPLDGVQIESRQDLAAETENKIEVERLAGAMKSLTAEQREVISLRCLGGLTSVEAGRVLNKRDGAVREMQRAAIQKLRNIMATDI